MAGAVIMIVVQVRALGEVLDPLGAGARPQCRKNMLFAVVAAVGRVVAKGGHRERVHLHERVADAARGGKFRRLPNLPARDRRRHSGEREDVFAQRLVRRCEQKRAVHARAVGHGERTRGAQASQQKVIFFVQRFHFFTR